MRKKSLVYIVSFLVLSTGAIMEAQGRWRGEAPPNILVNFGSPYSLACGAFKIKAKETLPLSIAVKNNNASRRVSVKILPRANDGNYSTIPNGFTVLGDNPMSPVSMTIGECRLFRFNIVINSNKLQYLKIIVTDEKNTILNNTHVLVNDPIYSDLNYVPFHEERLCDFSMSAYDGWLY